MALEDIKQEISVKVDEAYQLGVVAGGGGAIYTQEQLDQAVMAAKESLKAQIVALNDAQQASESASEQSLKDQILAL